jgi:hypothetical protein
MGQALTSGKPDLPGTDHGDLNVCSCRSGRTSTAVYMEGNNAQAGPEPLPTPTLDNAPIGDVPDAPLVGKRRDASGL